MKRMHDIQAKEGAVVIDGNPLPSPKAIYRHTISIYSPDEGETVYIIFYSSISKFSSWDEFVEFASAPTGIGAGVISRCQVVWSPSVGFVSDIQDDYIETSFDDSDHSVMKFYTSSSQAGKPASNFHDIVAEL